MEEKRGLTISTANPAICQDLSLCSNCLHCENWVETMYWMSPLALILPLWRREVNC